MASRRAARSGLPGPARRARPSSPPPGASLNLWSDGSVRWALLDWQARVDSEGVAIYRVEIDQASAPANTSGLQVVENDGQFLIDTGTARFRLGNGRSFPFDVTTTTDGAESEPARNPVRGGR